jgi:hypothetical protein
VAFVESVLAAIWLAEVPAGVGEAKCGVVADRGEGVGIDER